MHDLTEESTSGTVHVTYGEIDLDIHYHDAGSPDAPAVVMVHGGGPGASGWANFVENVGAFVGAGFRVLVPDCPGFGKSGPIVSGTPRPVLQAQALKGLADVLGVQRAHFVGNSLGAATVLQVALDEPDLIDRLVLVGTAGMGSSFFQPQPTDGVKKLLGLFRNQSREGLRALLDVFIYDQSRFTEEMFEARYQAMMANDAQHLKNFEKSHQLATRRGGGSGGAVTDYRAILPDFTSRLGEVRGKALVIHGRDDRFAPLDYSLRLVAGLPDAEMHVFSHCGHWAQWEHFERFNSLAIDFLKSA